MVIQWLLAINLLLFTGHALTMCMQEVLDEDMPDLPEYRAPEDSDISIELQFPSAGGEVSW